jgi:autotransporter adhesin
MAMAQLSEAGPGEELVLSIGTGYWEGSSAFAAGLSGRINQRLSLRGAASLASGNAGVSAAIGWRIK